VIPQRILVIAPYPPLQGGTASQSLWLAYRCAQLGIDVCVVAVGSYAKPAAFAPLTSGDLLGLRTRFPELSRVHVYLTQDDGRRGRSVLAHEPLATKLSSLALIRGSDAALVISVYLEPFALAADLVSRTLGIPHILIHAGSDLNRLAKVSSMRAALASVVARAQMVVTTTDSARAVLALGATPESLIVDRPLMTPCGLFVPRATSLGNSALPAIGFYGKLGAQKGFTRAVSALAELASQGQRFCVRLLTNNVDATTAAFAALQEYAPAVQVIAVPLVPPWRVPEFLYSCDIVCCLEHGFAVATHSPELPREIMHAGRTLMISRQLVDRLPAHAIRHGYNALVVDPCDSAELVSGFRDLVTDESLRRRLASHAPAGFARASGKHVRAWVSDLLTSAGPKANPMTLERFHEMLIELYAVEGARVEWATGTHGRDATLSAEELGTLRELALSTAVAEFSDQLMLKRWGMLARRFDAVWRRYPALATQFKLRFLSTWILTSDSLEVQIQRFADTLEAELLSLDAPPADARSRIRLECARALALLREPVVTRLDPATVPDDELVLCSPACVLVELGENPLGSSPDQRFAAVVPLANRYATKAVVLSPTLHSVLDVHRDPTPLKDVVRELSVCANATEADARTAVNELLARGILVVLGHPD